MLWRIAGGFPPGCGAVVRAVCLACLEELGWNSPIRGRVGRVKLTLSYGPVLYVNRTAELFSRARSYFAPLCIFDDTIVDAIAARRSLPN